MDIWVRDLDLERPRALEEEKDQPIGSPMPRYEGARGLWQVGAPPAAPDLELLLPVLETWRFRADQVP